MPQKYGYLANAEAAAQQHTPCVVCDAPQPTYSWTDYSGEAYCTACGTAYQLKWGKLEPNETYPRPNINLKWLPLLRRYWQETHSSNGSGTYLLGYQYPDQMEGLRQFNKWVEKQPEFAELTKEEVAE